MSIVLFEVEMDGLRIGDGYGNFGMEFTVNEEKVQAVLEQA